MLLPTDNDNNSIVIVVLYAILSYKVTCYSRTWPSESLLCHKYGSQKTPHNIHVSIHSCPLSFPLRPINPANLESINWLRPVRWRSRTEPSPVLPFNKSHDSIVYIYSRNPSGNMHIKREISFVENMNSKGGVWLEYGVWNYIQTSL